MMIPRIRSTLVTAPPRPFAARARGRHCVGWGVRSYPYGFCFAYDADSWGP
jgi:hypothetical protein